MSRILDKLEEFDDALTVGQLKKKLKEEKKAEDKKESDVVDKVKSDFKDAYLKVLDSDSIWGKVLEVYHIQEISSQHRTDRWELIYGMSGIRMAFSQTDIHYKEIDDSIHNTFSEEELRKMERITKEQFEDYKLRYDMIYNQLSDFIKE